MNADAQLELFPRETINPNSSIQAALGAFEAYLEEKRRRDDASEHTIRAFKSDIRLLGEYLGIGQPIGDIGAQDLNDFLDWMLNSRDVPCSLKTYNRRVTALKAFFGFLYESEIIPTNPASGIVYVSYSSPVTALPTEADIERALELSLMILEGLEGSKPDSRPHFLLTLLLETGIKKSEVEALVPNHIDREDPEAPFLFIRYRDPRKRPKDRKLPLNSEWLQVLDRYLDQYEPSDRLFTCTTRNLEYILAGLGKEAGLDKGALSFENLRWYWALEQYLKGTSEQELIWHLGIAKNTWPATKSKLQKLAQRRANSPVVGY